MQALSLLLIDVSDDVGTTDHLRGQLSNQRELLSFDCPASTRPGCNHNGQLLQHIGW